MPKHYNKRKRKRRKSASTMSSDKATAAQGVGSTHEILPFDTESGGSGFNQTKSGLRGNAPRKF